MTSENYSLGADSADGKEMSSDSYSAELQLGSSSSGASESYSSNQSAVYGSSLSAVAEPQPSPTQQPSGPSADGAGGGGGGAAKPDFEISPGQIAERLKPGERKTVGIYLKNTGNKRIEIRLKVNGDAAKVLFLEKTTVGISPNEEAEIISTIVVTETGLYIGNISAEGDGITRSVPVTVIAIANETLLDVKAAVLEKKLGKGRSLTAQITLFNLGSTARVDVLLKYWIEKDGKAIRPKEETLAIETQASVVRQIDLDDLAEGEYDFRAVAEYSGKRAESRDRFEIAPAKAQVEKGKEKEGGEPLLKTRLLDVLMLLLIIVVFGHYLRHRRKKRLPAQLHLHHRRKKRLPAQLHLHHRRKKRLPARPLLRRKGHILKRGRRA
ncbi:MAG: hypothetical protein HYX24_00760 [Candidatus Aenigmarchaeota archaeon]|nr:hypothetical protein [Candidatus Aenigmarchaeota archaeon]